MRVLWILAFPSQLLTSQCRCVNCVQVTESFNLLKSNGPEVITLLVEVSEIRAGGESTDALFSISLPFNNTPNEVILPVRNGK